MTVTNYARMRPAPVRRSWAGRVLPAVFVIAVAAVMASTPPTRLAFYVIYVVLCIRWPLDRVFTAFVFLTLVLDDPAGRPFRDLWKSPVQDIGIAWFSNVSTAVPGMPIKVSPIVLIACFMAFRAATARTGPKLAAVRSTRPMSGVMRSALLAAVGAIAFSTAWGILRHGDKPQMFYQVAPLLLGYAVLVTAMTIGNVDLAQRIRKIILIAAAYRAALLCYVWFTHIRGLPQLPRYATSHSDSALWTVALIIVVARFLEHPDRRSRRMLMFVPLLMFCLVINNRRLAWLMLIVAVVYVCLASVGRTRMRLSKMMPVLAPLLAIYIVVGMAAPPSTVFAPVQAIQSMGSDEDASSQTRAIENFNLQFTMRETAPIGTGFGHPYTEAIPGGDAVYEWFPDYDFQPHNSVFGYLMWMGPFGFALAMGPICLAIQAAHRTRRATGDRFIRTTCVVAISAICFYFLEGYADFGLQTAMGIVLAYTLGGICLGFDYDRTRRASRRPAAALSA